MIKKLKKAKVFVLTDLVAGIISLFLPKNNMIIYSGRADVSFNYNPRLLYEYAIQKEVYKDLGYRHVFVLRNSSTNEKSRYPNVHFLDPQILKDAITIWRAKIWITASRPIYFNPIGLLKIKYINAWHGIPFKAIGLKDKLASPFAKMRYRYYGLVAYKIVAPSIYFAKIFSESYGVKMSKIIISGSPVVEFLTNPSLHKNEDFKIKRDIKNILYAPTYRDYAGQNQYLSLNEKFKKRLEDMLGEPVELYYRPHPLADLPKSTSAKIISSDLIDELSYNYSKFDLIITDYSSVGIDAMIGGIPVLLYWKDHDVYMEKRGFGVSKEIYQYTDCTTDEEQLILKILQIFKHKNIKIVNEPFHIADRKTCECFFLQIKSAV